MQNMLIVLEVTWWFLDKFFTVNVHWLFVLRYLIKNNKKEYQNENIDEFLFS